MNFERNRSLRPMPAPLAMLLILAVSAVCAQQPHSASAQAPTDSTYRVGGKSIALPPPTGDLVEIGSDYRVVLEPLVPDTNRLVAAFVLRADARSIRSRTPPRQLSEYALVEVSRRAEFADVTSDVFHQVADAMAGQFGASLNASMKTQENEFNQRLKDLNPGAPTVTFDKPVPLGVLYSKPNAYAFGILMPISARSTTVKMIGGIAILRVQNRLLFVYLYNTYKDNGTVQWLRSTSSHWTDAILKANQWRATVCRRVLQLPLVVEVFRSL